MPDELQKKILELADKLETAAPDQLIQEAQVQLGKGSMALASSLGAEDQVLTHVLTNNFFGLKIFTIDTGRLHPETIDLMAQTEAAYSFSYEVLRPSSLLVEEMTAAHGKDLFYNSVELRKECCRVRKVVPLRSKLATLKAWITGLRRDQAVTRKEVRKVEWDEENGLVKINPLADWSEAMVWEYIRKHQVPYNALHDQGYPSIGCAPCTRAVKPGEDIRSGRWWWESPQHKECGLHPSKRKTGK
jgi:phosphoadenosine phosphosulfate reductase